MSISGSYLNIDSTATYELLSPVKQTLENNTVIKSTEILFYFWDENARVPSRGYSSVTNYESLLEMPKSDFELFNLLKNRLSAPPQNEDEKKMTPQELMKKRDPEGISQMPLETVRIQQTLAQIRDRYRREMELGAFGKIREAYQEALDELREEPITKPLAQIEITVIYAKRSDLGSNLTLVLNTPLSPHKGK